MSGIIDERLDPSKEINQPKVSNVENNNTGDDYGQHIPLPSLGVSYIKDNFLKDTIEVRPLDWTDEDILTTQSYVNDMIVFDKILDRVILDKTLKRSMLTVVDKDTILLWLRSQEFGPIMDVKIECPVCGEKHKVTWDLSKIEIPRYDPKVFEELTERNGEVLVYTPNTKLGVFLHIPTLAEIDGFKKRSTKKETNTDPDKISSESIKMIVSGVIDPQDENIIHRNKEDIARLFSKVRLGLSDLRFLRKEFSKIDLRYATEQNVKCDNCGYIQEDVSLPMAHKNFLWMDV